MKVGVGVVDAQGEEEKNVPKAVGSVLEGVAVEQRVRVREELPVVVGEIVELGVGAEETVGHEEMDELKVADTVALNVLVEAMECVGVKDCVAEELAVIVEEEESEDCPPTMDTNKHCIKHNARSLE